MIILFDATFIRNEKYTGIERYILNLLESFQNIKLPFSLYVAIRKSLPTSAVQRIKHLNLIEIDSTNRLLIDQYYIPRLFYRIKADLIHYPVFGLSPLLFNKCILTIHDVTFWRYPDLISLGAKLYYKPLLPFAIRYCKKIITVSESSKDEIVFFFGSEVGAKTVKIYEALDNEFKNLVNKINKSININEYDYILTVGTIEPRKNLATYIKAFEILKTIHNIKHKLVLTGRTGWIKEMSIPKSLKNEIVFTGYVSDSELAILYKNAALYIFPSLYEGFGFPLLEALASKIPVIASKTSSLIEIGENSCLYANPLDTNEWVTLSIKLLEDEKLRNDLINEGVKVIDKYDWNKIAGETMEVYINHSVKI